MRQAVRDHRRAVCMALLREVDINRAQLVLPPPIRAVPALIEDFYA